MGHEHRGAVAPERDLHLHRHQDTIRNAVRRAAFEFPAFPLLDEIGVDAVSNPGQGSARVIPEYGRTRPLMNGPDGGGVRSAMAISATPDSGFTPARHRARFRGTPVGGVLSSFGPPSRCFFKPGPNFSAGMVEMS